MRVGRNRWDQRDQPQELALNRYLLAFTTAVVLTFAVAVSVRAQTPATTSFDLLNHIQLELPEQDVFIESADDASMVLRVEGADAEDPTILAMSAYGTAEVVEHDPFKVGENPLGPFAKGAALGFTLADWLAGTGSGEYRVDGDAATLEIAASDLVPNGLYTVWCSRIKLPPEPEVTDYPCGADDGSENSFTTDSSGDGSIVIEMEPLEASTEDTVSVVALAYHSDGESHGASPGPFGQGTHVQLAWMAPAPEAAAAGEEASADDGSGAASEAAPETLPKTGTADSPGMLLAVGLVLVAVGAIWRRRTRRPGSSPSSRPA